MCRRVVATVKPLAALGLERVGTEYRGWIVPMTMIRSDWICYSGRAGKDITFDLEPIHRVGCTVFAFDPTPRAIDHAMRAASDEARFHICSVGLRWEDTTLRFSVSRDPTHVSQAVVNLQQTIDYFEAPCRSVPSLMTKLGHRSIDLRKLDIEDAEHRVIRSILDVGLRPTALCTGIDRPVLPLRFWATIRRVVSARYMLAAVDHRNFTFVRSDALSAALTDGT